MKNLLSYLKPYTKMLIIGPAFKLAEAVLELMLPFLMSKVIDIGIADKDTSYVWKIGLLMIMIATVGIICAVICQYCASIVSQGVGTDIRNAVFQKIGGFSNTELDRFGTASLANRITNDVNQIQTAVAMLIRLVIRAPFLCVGGLVMAFILNLKLSVIMVVVLPVFLLILSFTMKKTIPFYRKVQQKLDNIALVLRENLNGVRVIRAFAQTRYEEERFADRNNEYQENAIRVGRISALINPLTNLVMNFAVGAILWYGGRLVNIGGMSSGEVLAYIGYVGQILAALIVISNLVVLYTKAFASAGRVCEVLAVESSIRETGDSGSIKDKADTACAYAVEFRNVSMKYDADSECAVENISFAVKKGDTIGIIGGTGSGKSTVVNLIPRFYDTACGTVLVDGKDVREYSLQELRQKIGFVLQKSVLFTGTVADNIRWGKKDASEKEIKEAAKTAQAAEFIEKMPMGYDTIIQSGGVNVSGGQRQRLSIARALVRKPQILILDDSFNALDFATDAALRKAIRTYTSDMTTFIVSQRASTIRHSDQIIVMNDGDIAGIGSHDELYESCSVYQEICQSQMQEKEVK